MGSREEFDMRRMALASIVALMVVVTGCECSPEPAATVKPLPTVATIVPTSVPTETPTPFPKDTQAPTDTSEPTRTPAPSDTPEPTLTPTPSPRTGVGTIRGYLCPLSILIVFSIGVLALSIVLPRIRERQDQAALNAVDALFAPANSSRRTDTTAEDLLIGVSDPGSVAIPMDALFSEEDVFSTDADPIETEPDL